MATGTIKMSNADRVVKTVTGSSSKTYKTLIQSLFSGISASDYMKYYVKLGNNIFHPFNTSGEFVQITAADVGFTHMLFRVIKASTGDYYEGNNTLALTSYSTSTTAGQTFQLVLKAGYC